MNARNDAANALSGIENQSQGTNAKSAIGPIRLGDWLQSFWPLGRRQIAILLAAER
jgi:hypothetical protein